jgi:hypothetical protein
MTCLRWGPRRKRIVQEGNKFAGRQQRHGFNIPVKEYSVQAAERQLSSCSRNCAHGKNLPGLEVSRASSRCR